MVRREERVELEVVRVAAVEQRLTRRVRQVAEQQRLERLLPSVSVTCRAEARVVALGLGVLLERRVDERPECSEWSSPSIE